MTSTPTTTPQWLADLVAAHPRYVLRWQPPPYNPSWGPKSHGWPDVEPECPTTPTPDARHAAELRAHPYRWGCVYESGQPGRAAYQASRIAAGQQGFGRGFQAVSRRLVGGGDGTFARYVGKRSYPYPAHSGRAYVPKIPRARRMPVGTSVTAGRTVLIRTALPGVAPWRVADRRGTTYWTHWRIDELVFYGAKVIMPSQRAPSNTEPRPAGVAKVAKTLPVGTVVTSGRVVAERTEANGETPWWVTDGTDGRRWPNTLVDQLINQGAAVTPPGEPSPPPTT